VIVRAPGESEADAVAAFLAECDTAELGAPDGDVDDLREQWSLPGFDPARDAWVVEEDARLLGYAYAWARGGRAIHSEARVRPDVEYPPVGELLFERIESRTREQGIETATVLLIGSSPAGKAFAEERGYRLARHYIRMLVDLAEPPARVEAPTGVVLRTAEPGRDEPAVWELMREAFADEYEYVPETYDAWRQRLVDVPSFDPGLWFLAEAGGELVGATQCYPFLEGGWVQGIGVRPAWRRRGLGHALLAASLEAFWERGRSRVGLEVDAENPRAAKRLYERVGMREAFRFDRYEKDVATL
jgi:mycothiol synthase